MAAGDICFKIFPLGILIHVHNYVLFVTHLVFHTFWNYLLISVKQFRSHHLSQDFHFFWFFPLTGHDNIMTTGNIFKIINTSFLQLSTWIYKTVYNSYPIVFCPSCDYIISLSSFSTYLFESNVDSFSKK